MKEFDVIVCGGGMAGLVAATAAAEAGASVLLVEKGNRLGGSMLLSGGLVWALDGRSDVSRLLPHANQQLAGLVVDQLRPSLDWLRQFGLRVGPWETLMNGHGSRIDPHDAVVHFERLLPDAEATTMLDTGLADYLPRADGVEVMLVDRRNGRELRVNGRTVVIATGGYQGSPDLLHSYAHVQARHLILRANPWSTGDGFSAALRRGGMATRALDEFYGHSMPDVEPDPSYHEKFRTHSQYYGSDAVAVNLAGRRFVDESAGTGEELLNCAIARQPSALAYYIIDDRTARTVRLPDGSLAITAVERAKEIGGFVAVADTLQGLVNALTDAGVPGDALGATLARFNAHVLSDTSPSLYPPRVASRNALVTPPFYAVRVRAAITFTMGGLAVDPSMRLLKKCVSKSPLDPSRDVVEPSGNSTFPRVFVAGVDVGDLSAGGYLGGLASALVTGRVAGASAAHASRSN